MDGTGLYDSLANADMPVEDWRSSLMDKKIDLYNFESLSAEDCAYILTSPRSLRACARMRIQPVELLTKPEIEFEEELLTAGKQPGEASRKLYDAHERQRLRKLYMCRRAREEIVQEEGGREMIESIDHAQLLFQGVNKPPERTIKPSANGIDSSKVAIPRVGTSNCNLRPGASPRSLSHPSTRSSSAKTSATSSRTSAASSKCSSTSSSKAGPSSNPSHRSLTDISPRYAQRSASVPPSSRARPRSGFEGTCRTPSRERNPADWERASRSLMRSRPYSASNLSERDQRILDCMIFKREQEKEELKHQQVVKQVWHEERQKEEKARLENEMQRRKHLVEKERDRHRKREKMRRQREKEEKEKLKEAEISIKYKDVKHKHLASQQDLLKIQQIDGRKQVEKSKKEKQSQLFKEKEAKDEEYRRTVEKHVTLALDAAEAKRLQKQHHEVKELQIKNKQVVKQHAARKKVIDKKTEEENEQQRKCLDVKDTKHKELYDQQQFQRHSEIRHSRKKLEKQQKKTNKAKTEIDNNLEKWRDGLSKHRTVVQDQAAVKVEKNVQVKAQKAQELRVVKEKTHKERIARVAEDAEMLARHTEAKIKHKDRKTQEVICKKQQEIDRSRAKAQNSAKLREQIRNQYSRSFDKMAQRAELDTKLGAGPSLGTKNYSHVIIS